jgi:hypothetical protein
VTHDLPLSSIEPAKLSVVLVRSKLLCEIGAADLYKRCLSSIKRFYLLQACFSVRIGPTCTVAAFIEVSPAYESIHLDAMFANDGEGGQEMGSSEK